MKQQIEGALNALLGTSLWGSGRAGVQWFAFGNKRIVPRVRLGETNGMKEVGDYALHVSCPWRIVGPRSIIVGSRDRYYSDGHSPYQELPDSALEKAEVNRLDVRLAEFLQSTQKNSLVVEELWADAVGSLSIFLTGGYKLELFPDDSLDDEHWRFFAPNSTSAHFVVTGKGIEI